jgi:hypothetical protein
LIGEAREQGSSLSTTTVTKRRDGHDLLRAQIVDLANRHFLDLRMCEKEVSQPG